MVIAEHPAPTPRAAEIGASVEAFVRDVVIAYESDQRRTPHGPAPELVEELRGKARAAGLLTPHIRGEEGHLTHLEAAFVLKKSGLSPLGPVALNTMAPDEGNMYLIGRIGSDAQKRHFLSRLVAGTDRSAFMMTEPADEGGAGSDPSMLSTRATWNGDHWIITGRKAFITGADGAGMAIVMADTGPADRVAATMFLVDLPDPAIRIERILDTIDSSMPGGHSIVAIDGLRAEPDQVLGAVHEGLDHAQLRLAPARLTHCMRWLGACIRANEIATRYACGRQAFGKPLIDHEGVGFMLADNLIDIRQCELTIDWVARLLDEGALAITESSMAKVAISEALFRIADRCVQIMGGTGVSGDTVVEQVFREVRAFRIYDGPTEVHRWSLAKKIKRSSGLANPRTPATPR